MRTIGWWMLITALVLPGAAWGELDGGAGIEYFSVQAYTRDSGGNYFKTLIQSTLAKAMVEYRQAGWFGRLTGGITDWRSGGAWEGTGFNADSVNEAYLSTWQQQVQGELGYGIALGEIGVGYSDYQLKNVYSTLGGFIPRLSYRLKTLEVFARFLFFHNDSTQLALGGGYAPKASVELYHNGYANLENADHLYEVDSAGTGPRWHGTLSLRYRDSAKWGIDVIYDAGWAQFSNPRNLEEITLRSGSLTGYFILWF